MKKYTVGIDYGTLSARAVVMDVESGETVATAVSEYSKGVIAKELFGKPLAAGTALQDAADHARGLSAIKEAVEKSGVPTENIVGIGIDFTGCTMLPVDKEMRPLSAHAEYKNEPHAYVKLWKHNAASKEGDELDRLAKRRGEQWLSYYGGKTSAEWMFSKILQIKREAPEVYDRTYMFLNSADWIVYLLTGEITNSASFAGYKELWNEKSGFPSPDFLAELCPDMRNIVGDKISDNIISVGGVAGCLTAEGARLTGLKEGTPVATPVLDAHASVPALGLSREGELLMILGTSGVYLIHSKEERRVDGIAGYMKDGIINGLYTYEACQACVGDHLDWFVKNSLPAAYTDEARARGISPHQLLREKVKDAPVGAGGLLCLEWLGGNRSPLKDLELTGAIFGLTLRTRPEEIYRAMIEGSVFGAKVIIDNFESHGVCAEKIFASGGIAEKDEMTMQIFADVLGREITVPSVKNSAARGGAIYASVAAGIYESVNDAVGALGVREGKTYYPRPENTVAYAGLYAKYLSLYRRYGEGNDNLLRELRAPLSIGE